MGAMTPSYDPLLALPGALAAISGVVIVWRRARRQPVQRRRPTEPSGDFGLLVTVATVLTTADVEMLRDVLGEHGIRATAAPVDTEVAVGWHVLVFPDDAARAREVLATR